MFVVVVRFVRVHESLILFISKFFSNSSSASSEPEPSPDAVKSLSSSRLFCVLRTFQWRHSPNESNQSDIWSWAQMEGTGYIDVVTRKLSPCNSSCRFRPSNDTHDVLRLSIETDIFNSTPAGTTIGRKLSECGQIGVTMIAGTDGWIIDAPAATA